MAGKMTNCLWFDHGEARKAAEFYASIRIFEDQNDAQWLPRAQERLADIATFARMQG